MLRSVFSTVLWFIYYVLCANTPNKILALLCAWGILMYKKTNLPTDNEKGAEIDLSMDCAKTNALCKKKSLQ